MNAKHSDDGAVAQDSQTYSPRDADEMPVPPTATHQLTDPAPVAREAGGDGEDLLLGAGRDAQADGMQCVDGSATPEADGSSPPSSATARPEKAAHERVTPLPMGQILVLVVVMMTESIGGYALLPFVGLFVAHLLDWSVDDSGYVAGVLVGAFMLGQVISSKFWGYLSDQYGRRIPLAIGLIVGAAMMLLFGFSTHIAVAAVARLVQGFFNGTVLVAKTVVAEITDRTNVAKGFAWVSFSWGVGTLLGAAIGGFLYDPVTRMHLTGNTFFARFPAFIPCLICAAYYVFAWLLALCYLKETNTHRKPIAELLPRPLRRCLPRSLRTVPTAQPPAATEEMPADDCAGEATAGKAACAEKEYCAGAVGSVEEPVNGDEDAGDEEENESVVKPSVAHTTAASTEVAISSVEVVESRLTYVDAFRCPRSRYLLLIFAFWCAADMAATECLPLWAIATKPVGGLDVGSDMVSVLMLAMGVPSILANVVFSYLCSFFPDKTRFYRVSIVYWAVLTVVLPAGGCIAGAGGYWFSFVMSLIRQPGLCWAYGLCYMLIPRVSPPEHVGEMNGIANSCAALMRGVTPFFAAPLFAWSISSTPRYFPYNHFFVFVIAAVLAMLTFALSFFLDLPLDLPPAAQALDAPTENNGSHHSEHDEKAASLAVPATAAEEGVSGIEKPEVRVGGH